MSDTEIGATVLLLDVRQLLEVMLQLHEEGQLRRDQKHIQLFLIFHEGRVTVKEAESVRQKILENKVTWTLCHDAMILSLMKKIQSFDIAFNRTKTRSTWQTGSSIL